MPFPETDVSIILRWVHHCRVRYVIDHAPVSKQTYGTISVCFVAYIYILQNNCHMRLKRSNVECRWCGSTTYYCGVCFDDTYKEEITTRRDRPENEVPSTWGQTKPYCASQYNRLLNGDCMKLTFIIYLTFWNQWGFLYG